MFWRSGVVALLLSCLLSALYSLEYSPLQVQVATMLRSSAGAIRRCASTIPFRRRYATVTDLQQYPKPGEQLHGFTLKRSKHFPELELSALELQHEKTG